MLATEVLIKITCNVILGNNGIIICKCLKKPDSVHTERGSLLGGKFKCEN